MRPTPSDLRTRLKEATSDLHASLDGHRAMAGLLEPDFPRSRYVALLQSYRALYAGLEPVIEAAVARLPLAFTYADRRKLPSLDADLRVLGGPGKTSDTVVVPWTIHSPGALAGVLYAVEGSTLGGVMIARALGRSLGVGPDTGGAFFAGYGEQTRTRWLAFLAFLESAAPTPESRDEAELFARHTFALFREALDRCLAACPPGGTPHACRHNRVAADQPPLAERS